MTDVTYIIVGIILVAGGLIGGFGYPMLKSKLSVEQLNALGTIANIAVYAAEQTFGAKMGKDKKAFALDYAKQLLSKFKLTFDEDVVGGAIEAQVKELKITTESASTSSKIIMEMPNDNNSNQQ